MTAPQRAHGVNTLLGTPKRRGDGRGGGGQQAGVHVRLRHGPAVWRCPRQQASGATALRPPAEAPGDSPHQAVGRRTRPVTICKASTRLSRGERVRTDPKTAAACRGPPPWRPRGPLRATHPEPHRGLRTASYPNFLSLFILTNYKHPPAWKTTSRTSQNHPYRNGQCCYPAFFQDRRHQGDVNPLSRSTLKGHPASAAGPVSHLHAEWPAGQAHLPPARLWPRGEPSASGAVSSAARAQGRFRPVGFQGPAPHWETQRS